MKKIKNIKRIRSCYAKENILKFFEIIEGNVYPKFNKFYIQEIKKISTAFNIRLSREEKLKFCKNCEIPWNIKTRTIYFNQKDKIKVYKCKNCDFIRRFPYKLVSNHSSSKL